jgi:WhiB family transcriptional regulator, redox-sensing transcriptional regulator
MQREPAHSWRYDAKCMDINTDLFYPPRDRRLYKGIADKAKAICWGTGEDDPECPVRRECLWYAIEMEDTHGIWGGMSHRERSHLQRKFNRMNSTKTFKQFVMEHDGGAKAKRFVKKVPGQQANGDAARRANRAALTHKAEGQQPTTRRTPPV